MKHLRRWLTLLCSLIAFNGFSQAYHGIRFSEPSYTTIEEHSGISCSSITPQPDGSFKVVLYNSNRNEPDDITTYSFKWYLSYKGKRVSDYYQTNLRCRKSTTKTALCWPGEVPNEYLRYVTVQFGGERNYRDDEY